MSDRDLIRKLALLKGIQPDPKWVSWNRRLILGDFQPPGWAEQIWEIFRLAPAFKPALATITFLGLLAGVFGLAQAALPGDALYLVKKLTEKTRSWLVPQNERPVAQLELADKRLAELEQIAQNNQTRNLGPAISEFQQSQQEAAQSLKNFKNSSRSVRGIAQAAEKIRQNKQKVESLGVAVGETKELNRALAELVEREIQDLDGRTLTDAQKKLLEQAKAEYQKGDFNQALGKILLLSYPQEQK